MRTLRLARFATAAMLALAAACSDSPTQPTSGPVDLSTALGELNLSVVNTATSSVGVSLPSATISGSGCSYDASVQSFVCAPVTSNGLTISSSYALLTAAGTPQSAFDQATTDAIRTKSSVVGSISSSQGTLHLDDQRTSTLSGLVSGHHVIDGTGTTHMTGTIGTYALDETMTTTIAGLLPPLKGGNGYPRGGTITLSMVDAAHSGLPSSTVTMSMTFNGTSTVAVTMTSGGMTQHCTMNLASSSAGMSCS